MNDQANQPRVGQAIGASLEATKQNLLDVTQRFVAADADEELRDRVEPIVDSLTSHFSKVAFVGQVKAGKSTLVNCLTHKADLLPSDINPWTTVVTQLNFGHPSGRHSGAIFRFFDDAQWDRLAKRGGRLGELTEGLLEDYKKEMLNEQVEAMRHRAQLRLSDQFETLLGKAHRFEKVNRSVIERYVCSGDAPQERIRNPQAGRFNDITRVAEIYFEQEPFGTPICVMDTPGINDPLLIREEITQQHLENAEYFVVVLSAHQPLTESDVRLVRILKALKRDQIVVFVNRIDEIHHLAEDFEELRGRVKANLNNELEGLDVPVLMGSAAWANYSITGDESDIDPEALEEFAKFRGVELPEGGLENADEPTRRAIARQVSGLTELEDTLSTMLLNGAKSSFLGSAASALVSLSRQSSEQTKIRLDYLSQESGPGRTVLTPETKEEAIKLVRDRLSMRAHAITQAGRNAWAKLLTNLEGDATKFAKAQQEGLAGVLATLKRGQDIHIDLDPLRDRLRDNYVKRFDEIQNRIWLDLRALSKELRELFDPEIEKRLRHINIETLGVLSLSPRTDPLYRTVTLDLSTGWLGSLFESSGTKAEKMVNTIQVQFADMCRELIESRREEFETAVERSANSYIIDVTRILEELAGKNVSSVDTSEAKREADAAEAQAQLELTETVVKELEGIAEELGLETELDD
ncbi:MAG: dynamin family protein [Rhodobacteraceae bacterium]|nr:dynamin family protein [Paracoccaceae bacterium]